MLVFHFSFRHIQAAVHKTCPLIRPALSATRRRPLAKSIRSFQHSASPSRFDLEEIMKRVLMLLAIALLCGAVNAQTLAPTRTVRANVLESARDPAVVIELPKQVRYVGADRWILYDVADCELHIFVEADEQKNVKRLFWIQFEGYIPSRPELKYAPSSTPTVTMAGMDFHVRARFGPTTDTPKPGSELERVMPLLRNNGYKLPPEMMNARFIHYLDKQMRQELMIIYAEDLATSGFTNSQLIAGNAPTPAWTKIAEGLTQRAQERIVIRKGARP
jgi:hypothetical protein